jgi:hypothetical protein
LKISVLVALLVYWGFFIIIFSSSLGSPFSSDYNTTAQYNSSNFDGDTEIESGGFFTGLIGVFKSGARFFGLALFGIGLPSSTPNWVQFIFTTWQVIISMITIAFIVSIFWDG